MEYKLLEYVIYVGKNKYLIECPDINANLTHILHTHKILYMLICNIRFSNDN